MGKNWYRKSVVSSETRKNIQPKITFTGKVPARLTQGTICSADSPWYSAVPKTRDKSSNHGVEFWHAKVGGQAGSNTALRFPDAKRELEEAFLRRLTSNVGTIH
jgi:hypothetical protein